MQEDVESPEPEQFLLGKRKRKPDLQDVIINPSFRTENFLSCCKCHICWGILLKPTVFSPCGHTFCEKCSLRLRVCPLDRQMVDSRARNIQVQQLLNEVQCRCDYADCTKTFSILDREKHVENCGHKIVRCKNLFCTRQMKLQDLPAHDKVCEWKVLSCPHQNCPARMRRKKYDNHVKHCKFRIIFCPGRCHGCQVRGNFEQMQQHGEVCIYSRFVQLERFEPLLRRTKKKFLYIKFNNEDHIVLPGEKICDVSELFEEGIGPMIDVGGRRFNYGLHTTFHELLSFAEGDMSRVTFQRQTSQLFVRLDGDRIVSVPWSDDPGEIVKRALDWGHNPMFMQTSNPPGALYSSLGKCLYSDGESRATTKDFGVVAGATLDYRKY